MTKKLKEVCEWVESVGYSPQACMSGDWHTPLHLLSKLMAKDLEQRRRAADIEDSEVTMKISFDSMLQLAEDSLGVPVLVTEKDLLVRYPNVHLALVTYMACLKNTIEHYDPKQIRGVQAPKLVFEAKNGLDASLPVCPVCNAHVFIIERIVIERAVYHRQCLKCTECGQLLSRGAFKRGKNGFECITHAVRKILDAHESASSGSGTYYDRYGGKSPRPNVAPPPRPKPKPPPKPLHLSSSSSTSSSRPDPVYETLDAVDSVQEKKPDIVREEVRETSNPFDEEDEVKIEDSEEKEEKGKSAQTSPVGWNDESSGDNSSCDSGVVMRMAKMFDGDKRIRASQPQLPATPVAPPRPKRTSMLVTSGMSPSPTLKRSFEAGDLPSRIERSNCELENYPGYLCPFGEDEEEEENSEANDYPDAKNPFADSDDEGRGSTPPIPAPRSLPPPVPVLPGTSDRPKVQPPPPPPGAQVIPSTPPPKPPRTHAATMDTRIHTLKISRKKRRAPLPPVPQMRKINFTEKGSVEEPALIKGRLAAIEESMTRIEIEGRAVEKEMLFQIETNPRTWSKSPKADDWVEILTRKLELMKEQLYLLGLWRENYLNEVHAETEYYIRCLLEKDKIEKSEWEMEREATLTNLLIYIIDEKLKLDEYMVDFTSADDARPRSRSEKAEKKKSKLRKRVFMLTKKLSKSKSQK